MPDTANWADQNERKTDILIIGSGFAGLAAAIKLQEAGFTDFLILEKAGDVGGTWRDNSYPGCACDVPSHLYSFSFAPKSDWSRMFAPQPEIQAYLQSVADRYDLRPKIRFHTTMIEAAWEAAAARWRVATSTGPVSARVVISGAGGLHIQSTPALPGLENFAGAKFHSAAWDHSFDLAGKRVAVIGTGASAIQFVPQIAPLVEKLHLFQRTPAWIMRKPDRVFSARAKKLFAFGPLRAAFRGYLFWLMELRVLAFLGNKRALKLAGKMARTHIHDKIADPALRAKLTPDYALGCKRVMISNDFYPALNRANVELVTSRIAEIRAETIVDTAGVAREVDAIIFGTGFEVTSAYRHTKITGAGGRDLREVWDAAGMTAYKGISVAGFPNYFMLTGPNTGLGHNSIIFMIEAQVNYIVSALKQMRQLGVAAIDVRPRVQDEFVARLRARFAGTVWQDGGCASWYKDSHGRVSALWPGSAFSYRKATATADLQDFELLTTPAHVTA